MWEILLNHGFVKEAYDLLSKTFVIKIHENDLNYVYANYQNITDNHVKIDCFYICVSYSNNIEMIIFLLDKFNINIDLINSNGDTFLITACKYNHNLDIIKYLIENCKISTEIINNENENCLMVACQFNHNLDIIKYLIHGCEMSANIRNKDRDDCLILACYGNQNIEIIEYLIQECYISIENTEIHGYDCLMMACLTNTNPQVIVYLIERCKMCPNKYSNDHENCLSIACENHDGLEIIKYLIEGCKVSTEFIDNTNNFLMLACLYNENLEIIRYLSENTSNTLLRHKVLSFDQFSYILPGFKNNYLRLNEYLEYGANIHGIEKLYPMIHGINPLMLNDYHKKLFNVDPYTDKVIFGHFIHDVDMIKQDIITSDIMCDSLSADLLTSLRLGINQDIVSGFTNIIPGPGSLTLSMDSLIHGINEIKKSFKTNIDYKKN